MYAGCPNVLDYAVPECFIPLAEGDRVDWLELARSNMRDSSDSCSSKELSSHAVQRAQLFSRLAQSPELLAERRPLSLLGASSARAA